jgi:hypothetical protein
MYTRIIVDLRKNKKKNTSSFMWHNAEWLPLAREAYSYNKKWFWVVEPRTIPIWQLYLLAG